ncbi:MAG: sigma-54 dependent transcriptional regulator [Pseudomonadota bacterium]|nr:sigma-54 dependent transcriptional regulator [Pseudomonadota bacterium]
MNQGRRALVCFDPSSLATGLEAALRSAGWEVHTVADAAAVRETVERHAIAVGLASFGDAGTGDSRRAMEELLAHSGGVEWVGLIKPALLKTAAYRQLIHHHLYDFHTLPIDRPRLLDTLNRAAASHAIKSTIAALQSAEEKIIWGSAAMNAVFRTLGKIAGVDVPVLIGGESGTGKELAAQAIHQQSGRAGKPFVAVNCGALPASLIQSELFGHEKGAFTGAHCRKIGRIEAANGGTLFLDEIGDLPLDQQVNLLRFLQEGTIERLGSPQTLRLDVRVVAATHANLKQAIAEGRFREDLYYRLNVLHLDMPPLRQRRDDIELLAQFYLQKFSQERPYSARGFSQQALQAMSAYDWPGNVRELINRIRRALLLCEHRAIGPADLGLERRSSGRILMTLEQARAEAEKQAIQNCLRYTRNNVSEAARQLDISRVTLYRLMEKHQLSVRS